MKQLSLLDRVENIVETSIPQSHIYILNIAKTKTESSFIAVTPIPKYKSHLSISSEESGISLCLFSYISYNLVTDLDTDQEKIIINKDKTIKRVFNCVTRELDASMTSQAYSRRDKKVSFEEICDIANQTSNRDMLNAILLVSESHVNNPICSKTMLEICKALSEKYGVKKS